MTLVFLKPVGDLFELDSFVVAFDGFFDRDNVPSDTITARTDHRGDFLKREESPTFEKGSNGWSLIDSVFRGIE